MSDEPHEWLTPEQIRASAWKMFEKAAQLQEQAEELTRGARKLLEMVPKEHEPVSGEDLIVEHPIEAAAPQF